MRQETADCGVALWNCFRYIFQMVRALLFILAFVCYTSSSNAWAVEDYYEALGIDRTATKAEIEKAYRRLLRHHHPSLFPGDPSNSKIFELGKEAYNTLNDDARRESYDRAVDDGSVTLSATTTFDAQAGWTLDFDFEKVARNLIDELAQTSLAIIQNQEQPLTDTQTLAHLDSLTLQALHILQRDVSLPLALADNSTALTQRLQVAFEIWLHTRAWQVEKGQDQRTDVMEAAYRAAFLFAKRFRPLSLEIFENGWKKGISMMAGFEMTGAAASNIEYRRIAIRTRQFAKRYLEEEWLSTAPANSCDQVLANDVQSKP